MNLIQTLNIPTQIPHNKDFPKTNHELGVKYVKRLHCQDCIFPLSKYVLLMTVGCFSDGESLYLEGVMTVEKGPHHILVLS